MPYVVTNACILCGACITGCESDAISEGDTQVYINPAICIECGTCASNCPSAAIEYIVDLGIDDKESDMSEKLNR